MAVALIDPLLSFSDPIHLSSSGRSGFFLDSCHSSCAGDVDRSSLFDIARLSDVVKRHPLEETPLARSDLRQSPVDEHLATSHEITVAGHQEGDDCSDFGRIAKTLDRRGRAQLRANCGSRPSRHCRR